MRRLLILAALMFMSGISATAQCSDQLSSETGAGCNYSNPPARSGHVGCWATGICALGRNLDVNFYQDWACSSGTVTTSGFSTVLSAGNYCPPTFTFQVYPNGLEAGASAYVNGTTYYGGWDTEDCLGGVSYSGPFSYKC